MKILKKKALVAIIVISLILLGLLFFFRGFLVEKLFPNAYREECSYLCNCGNLGICTDKCQLTVKLFGLNHCSEEQQVWSPQSH
jgi:hypothetical protein